MGPRSTEQIDKSKAAMWQALSLLVSVAALCGIVLLLVRTVVLIARWT